MRILVDTNVLIDVLLRREPFLSASLAVVESCQKEISHGAIAAHSVTNMMYVLRKNFSPAHLRRIILTVFKIFAIEPIDRKKLEAALGNEKFSDFEDCLQMECALSFGADYIVTRNVKDFSASEIPCVTPEEFCRLLSSDLA